MDSSLTGLLYNTRVYSEATRPSSELVEYHLLSWREIVNTDLAAIDRYKSSAGSVVIGSDSHEPYEVSIISYPYDELPQTLMLRFECFQRETHDEGMVMIDYPVDSVAAEFAAFMALFTRKPVPSVGIRRIDDQPLIREPVVVSLENRQGERLSRVPARISNRKIRAILRGLGSIDEKIGVAVMNAIKLHYAALNMVYFDPSIAYVLLVSAMESVAGVVHAGMVVPFNGIDKFQLLNKFISKLTLTDMQASNWEDVKNNLGKGERHLIRKYREFIVNNVPEDFFVLDDEFRTGAKGFQIARDKFERALVRAYTARSKYLHEGRSFPEYVDFGVRDRVSSATTFSSLPVITAGMEHKDFVPFFLWFERVVHYSLTEYLKRTCAPEIAREEALERDAWISVLRFIENARENVKLALKQLVEKTPFNYTETWTAVPGILNADWADDIETVKDLMEVGAIECGEMQMTGRSAISGWTMVEVLKTVFDIESSVES